MPSEETPTKERTKKGRNSATIGGCQNASHQLTFSVLLVKKGIYIEKPRAG